MIVEDYLIISALQHYAFCPRQFALIHVEQFWEENRFTAEGKILHERVDSGAAEQRRDIRYERGVLIQSEQYRIQGKMDLLEIHKDGRYLPVEYKRGKAKTEPWDKIQLCAQALCLEEMRNIQIDSGALWYWETRKRETVEIDAQLRAITQAAIQDAHNILQSGKTPMPTVEKKRCRACSLNELCQPDLFRTDKSKSYIEQLA